MQLALGSVLKLTRSAFGGLGSFRAPSIRRALPVLLGGLLCAVVSPAMAQTIERVSVTSTPTGGPTGSPNTVYIIGNTITIAVDYDANLSAAPGSPTLRFLIGSQSRTATCVGQVSASRLLCSYVVKEGDQGDNIKLADGDQLVGGNVPDRSGDASTDLATKAGDATHLVDGLRLALTNVAVKKNGAAVTDGFNAGTTIQLELTFAESGKNEAETGMSKAGAMGANLVLENAERTARYVDTTAGVARFNYAVVAGDNGAFGLKLTGVDALKDTNGNVGLATGWETTLANLVAALDAAERRVDTRGPRVTKIRIIRPVEGTVSGVGGSNTVEFDVTFDESLPEANGVSLRVKIGATDTSASCTHRTAASEKLTCTVTVADGMSGAISTPANPLNFDFIRDILGNDATPAFAAQRFSGVDVDAVKPTVASATISVPKAEEDSNIVIKVTFSENVKVGATETPGATISIDGAPGIPAEYASVSGKVIEFRRPLARDDLPLRTDTQRNVVVRLMALTLDGSITDLANNPADRDVEETAAHKTGTSVNLKARPSSGTTSPYADMTRPTLDRISLKAPVREIYGITDNIEFDVLFSERVATTGDVSLEVKIGGESKNLPLTGLSSRNVRGSAETEALGEGDYAGGGSVSVAGIVLPDDGDSILDGSTITFTRDYTLQGVVKECSSDGPCDDAIGRGWINDTAGDDTGISSSHRQETARITKSLSQRARVDTKRPAITAVALEAVPAPSAIGRDTQRYYGGGDTIRVRVTMSEDVTVNEANAPMIGLEVGPEMVYAGFEGMPNRKTLIFDYKVQRDDTDRNGIRATSIVKDRAGTELDGAHKDDAVIRDLAGNGCAADCEFTRWAGTHSSRHNVDGLLSGNQAVAPPIEDDSGQTTTPTVSPAGTPRVATSTAVPSSGYYTEGERIRIEIPMTTRVAYTSRPTAIIDFSGNGGGRVTANETPPGQNSFTGSILTFDYTVRAGDEGTISVTLNGQFTVEDGTRVVLGGARSLPSSYRVDARSPTLESLRITSSAGSDGTYTVGDNIVVSATFSEDVERQGTTDPSVPILVGDVTRTATLQSPNATSGGDTWVFSYKVVAGDNDTDGVSIAANALKGALEDAAGNDADIAHSAVSASTSHRVDTQAPSVTGVTVSGSGDDSLFLEGDTITATVTFDEEVDVVTRGSDAVRVQFNIGTEQRTATYAGGDGTEALTFTYDVAAGDTGQISLPADALEGEVEDAAGNEAEGTLALSGGPYTVDASAPMLVGAPSISSAPRTGDTYAVDETITLQVRFDEPVMVTGEPRLPIQVGPRPRNIVLYTSGSGTDTLTFSYTVRNGDTDDDGVSVDANALRLPAGAAIADVNGLTAAIEHGELPDQPGHKVDAIAPGIESVAITSTPASDDAYLIDEMIEVTVTFSEDIATDGTPTLDLMVGEGVRAAACAQGSASTQLTCSYTVVANDFDANGISVDENMLKGTITDMVGNPATLSHEALPDDPAHKVYAAAPEAVRTIDRLSLAAGGGTNSLDLTGIFTGFQLSYAAVSSNESVATASVSGTDLTVVSGMEGTARVTVTASNLAGEASVSFDVLVATDPAETAVLNDALAAIGRSMLSSTASVIGSRFELASTGSQMALGGSRFGGSLSPQMQRFLAGNDPFALEERMSERALFSGSGSRQAYGAGYGLTADRLFTGTSFNMPLNAMGTGDAQFAVWGAGDLQSFEGEPDDGMYDGSSSSGYIGVDARGDGWLAGVSVSRSGAEADYDFDGTARVTGVRGGGTLETSVTAFHPYARLEVGADSEVWVIGGFGGGEADLSRTHVSGSQSSDLSMAMAVGGLRRALAMEFGGADLSLRGDAGFLSLETDSGAMAVDGLSASVSRLRLGLEAAWEGESATPFVEVSGRFDGGDGQTGGGLELAGGLRILNPESGFGLEAKGRILAMHTGDGYSESGIGVTASFEPGAAGRGITFRLSPRWGGSADSTDLFWDEVGNVRDASQYAYGLDRAQTWGVDAALGYGFGLRSMPGVVTPFGQMDVTGDQDQRIRVGVRYGLMQGLLGGTQVELSAERVDGEMHRVGETRVLVSGRARF